MSIPPVFSSPSSLCCPHSSYWKSVFSLCEIWADAAAADNFVLKRSQRRRSLHGCQQLWWSQDVQCNVQNLPRGRITFRSEFNQCLYHSYTVSLISISTVYFVFISLVHSQSHQHLYSLLCRRCTVAEKQPRDSHVQIMSQWPSYDLRFTGWSQAGSNTEGVRTGDFPFLENVRNLCQICVL